MKQYSEYRALARETLKGRWNEMALMMFVLSLFGCAVSVPVALGTGLGSFANDMWLNMGGSGCDFLFAILVLVPLNYAFYNLCLGYARKEELYESYFSVLLKDFCAHWSKYVGSGLLMVLLVCLIAIPTLGIGAIILGLAYAVVPFVVRDNPDMSVRDILRTSRLMMRGHKWELFVLQLTFIGWVLLCFLTLFIGIFWLQPYITVTVAHFYEDVKAEYDLKKEAGL